MIKNIILSAIYLLLLTSLSIRTNTESCKVNTLYNSWNKATLNSLKSQTDTINNKYLVSVLNSYKGTYEMSQNPDNGQEYNKSYNYKLLQKISEYPEFWCGDFYIIENNSSGEVYQFKSHVLYRKGDDFIVYTFELEYENRTVILKKKKTVKAVQLIDPQKYHTKYGKGNNPKTILISHFNKDKVISSDFYFCFSMNKTSIVYLLE